MSGKPPPGAPPAPASTRSVPLDSDATRSTHLRTLGSRPFTLSITATLAIVALIVGTLAVSIVVGAGAAAASR